MRNFRVVVTLAVLLALHCTVFAVEKKRIFTARIVDDTGVESLVTELTTTSRRPGGLCHFRAKKGEADVELQFDKVSFIRFIGPCDQPVKYFRAAEVVLVSGKKETLYFQGGNCCDANNYGQLYGRDVDLGSDVELCTGEISTIQFLHDGTYKKCPVCGTYFYDTNLTHCPFDKARLEPQPRR